MSRVTTVMLTVDLADNELHEQIIKPIQPDHRSPQVTQLVRVAGPSFSTHPTVMDNSAGGGKYMETDFYAGGLNYVSIREVTDFLDNIDWVGVPAAATISCNGEEYRLWKNNYWWESS